MRTLRKLMSTLSIITTLFLARTFGTYLHSIGGPEGDFAIYGWRGKYWAFPTSEYHKGRWSRHLGLYSPYSDMCPDCSHKWNRP